MAPGTDRLPIPVHNRRCRPQACRGNVTTGSTHLTSRGVRTSARRSDDADVIRARLRAVLAEMGQTPGWVPPDDLLDGERDGVDDGTRDGPQDGVADGSGDGAAGPREALDPGEEPVDPDTGLPVGLGRHRAPGAATRLDPGRSGARALWLAGLLAAVLVVGWTWVDRPRVEQVPPEPTGAASLTDQAPPAPSGTPAGTAPGAAPTTGGEVVVSVVGQVARPGLVSLPAGSRVADALTAAGGLLPDADPAAVNAAALLTDGQQIAVGVPGAPVSAGARGSGAGNGSAGGLLPLNSATVADLDALPGIGPVLAQRIVDHRSAHGPFTSVEQLDDVSGIGPAISAQLAERVSV